MRVNADEIYWSYELGVVLASLHAAHRRLGTRPRPPVPIAPWAMRGRVRQRLRWAWGGEPVFGGEGEAPPADEPGARHAVRGDPLLRVRVLALLYGNPATPVSVPQVARVFGLRDSDVRAARPASAAPIGRAMMAPFSHWCTSLEQAGLIPSWPAELEAPAQQPPRPAFTSGSRAAHGRLRPLGGPGRK